MDLLAQIVIIENGQCMCQKGRETSEHYFLKCPLYRNKRTIIDDLHNKANTDTVHIETILYGTKIKHRDRNKTIA